MAHALSHVRADRRAGGAQLRHDRRVESSTRIVTRTTRRELDALAADVGRALGRPMAIGYAYGRPRLESADGARALSPRLPAGDLADWMRAWLNGWSAAASGRRGAPMA
jgi:hypothetical protein